SLSSIRVPYERALDALARSVRERDKERRPERLADAEADLREAQFVAARARELTRRVGRVQVAEAMKRGFEEAKSMGGLGATSGPKPSFQSALESRMSPAAARSHSFGVIDRAGTPEASISIRRELRADGGRIIHVEEVPRELVGNTLNMFASNRC